MSAFIKAWLFGMAIWGGVGLVTWLIMCFFTWSIAVPPIGEPFFQRVMIFQFAILPVITAFVWRPLFR